VDPRLPFARSEDRIKLLYRLPLSGNEKSVLTIVPNEADVGTAPILHDSECRLDIQEALLKTDCFDAVLLPGTLTRPHGPATYMTARQLAQMAFDRLKPGGLLIGHLDHVVAPRHLAQWATAGMAWRQALAWRGFETTSRCKHSLASVGFVGAECYFVEPHMRDPMALVSSIPAAAQAHFDRTIRRNRPLYSGTGYRARMALGLAGWAGLLQAHLFLWARKPC
jgi:hypothetical protein